MGSEMCIRDRFKAVGESAEAGVRRPRRRRRLIVAAVAAVAAIAALIGGAALAGAFDAGSPTPWPEPPLPAESVYPTNAAGQTYGGDKPLVTEPDLVKILATNGKVGYSLKSDVYPSPGGRMTAEAAAEMTKRSLRGYTVPVYESDGVTQIGVFQVGGPGSQAVYGRAGGTVTMEADADGNIVTTTVASDGTTTIETEALDGTVTTKTLTAAEAERLKQEMATPKPTATPTPEPDKPQAWLLERMSQLARDAGDAHATAWWEQQFRHYLKPIEGANSPESPYQQWATVWLVVLHGDFDSGSWRYWLLDRDSHDVLSQGLSDKSFDTSGPQLPPPQGPIKLGGD